VQEFTVGSEAVLSADIVWWHKQEGWPCPNAETVFAVGTALCQSQWLWPLPSPRPAEKVTS
jgi:hypothetical protein